MLIVDPPGTLLRAAMLGLLAGLGLALIAVTMIYVNARFSPPRLAAGHVWEQWRRRPFLWSLSLIASVSLVLPVCDALAAPLVQRDLYWVSRAGELLTIARLGGGTGYALVLAVATLGAYLARRRARLSAERASTGPSQNPSRPMLRPRKAAAAPPAPEAEAPAEPAATVEP